VFAYRVDQAEMLAVPRIRDDVNMKQSRARHCLAADGLIRAERAIE
jgi:hypothetical protein